MGSGVLGVPWEPPRPEGKATVFFFRQSVLQDASDAASGMFGVCAEGSEASCVVFVDFDSVVQHYFFLSHICSPQNLK